MLFSVVITTCNRPANILQEAIESVLNQSYRNIEIIIVNDSPFFENRMQIDELIENYKSKSNRIIYVVNESQRGGNFSRNLGASLSNGDVLSFLDDDDYWDNHRAEKVVKAIEVGYDIVYSDIVIVTDKNEKLSKSNSPTDTEKVATILAYNYMRGFSNVSFTKEIFEKAGRLDETIVAYQDQDLFIRMVPIGRVCYIHEPLSYYRISGNAISLNSKKKLKGMRQVLNKYIDLYKLYPESKKIKLENDYVNSLRNGWVEEATEIDQLLQEFDSHYERTKLFVTGKTKFYVLKLLSVFRR